MRRRTKEAQEEAKAKRDLEDQLNGRAPIPAQPTATSNFSHIQYVEDNQPLTFSKVMQTYHPKILHLNSGEVLLFAPDQKAVQALRRNLTDVWDWSEPISTRDFKADGWAMIVPENLKGFFANKGMQGIVGSPEAISAALKNYGDKSSDKVVPFPKKIETDPTKNVEPCEVKGTHGNEVVTRAAQTPIELLAKNAFITLTHIDGNPNAIVTAYLRKTRLSKRVHEQMYDHDMKGPKDKMLWYYKDTHKPTPLVHFKSEKVWMIKLQYPVLAKLKEAGLPNDMIGVIRGEPGEQAVEVFKRGRQLACQKLPAPEQETRMDSVEGAAR